MTSERATVELHGIYRDRLRRPDGAVTWDSGIRRNTIVVTCRQLLASFMRGTPAVAGIQGLQVGAGLDSWDTSGPPPPPTTQAALVDPHPYTVPAGALELSFIDEATGNVTNSPTNRLQILARLGPHVPTWPDANHASGTLREFALVGTLGGATVLINCVRHPAIPKDPVSTLERTIWLVF